MTREAIENEEAIRELFRRAFLDKDQPQVLELVLARLGYFTDRPEDVRPELQAFANWLLRKCGIIHDERNSRDLFVAQAHNVAAALAKAANDEDLVEMKKAINKGPGPNELDS
jgi:ABC-type nitrate/sulfonate/bicarbonate transport system substrate-binding protein